jgi:hypothetical protein
VTFCIAVGYRPVTDSFTPLIERYW